MWLIYIVMGLVAGSVSGMLGIGGGLLLVPAFVYLLDMSQKTAQGTSVAIMLPPISALAFMTYWKQGHVDFLVAAWVCVGFIAGSWAGAYGAMYLEQETLKRLFGLLMLMVSMKLLLL